MYYDSVVVEVDADGYSVHDKARCTHTNSYTSLQDAISEYLATLDEERKEYLWKLKIAYAGVDPE